MKFTMKAARFYSHGDIRIEDVPAPASPPRPDYVTIKIAYCGICGTDVHEYLGGPVFCPNHIKTHPITKEKAPVTLGHEFSGTITDLGPNVDTQRLHIGDNVTVEPTIGCGNCDSCNRGERNTCPELGFVGLSGWGGGLSSYISLPQHMVHVLPENVSLEAGAMVEPLAVAWHAVKKGNVAKGYTVVVFGAGPIGCFLVKVLKAKGAKWIAVAEPTERRAQLAKKCGADIVVDPKNTDIVQACLKATNGRGCDVAFDAAGTEVTVYSAIKSIRTHGTVVNIAIWENPVLVNMNDILLQEKNYTGVICYSNEYPEVIEALTSGTIIAEDMITARIKIEEVVEKGFKALVHHKDEHIKILVSPSS